MDQSSTSQPVATQPSASVVRLPVFVDPLKPNAGPRIVIQEIVCQVQDLKPPTVVVVQPTTTGYAARARSENAAVSTAGAETRQITVRKEVAIVATATKL